MNGDGEGLKNLNQENMVLVAFKTDKGILALVNRKTTKSELHIALGELQYYVAVELGRKEMEERVRSHPIIKPKMKHNIMDFARRKQ